MICLYCTADEHLLDTTTKMSRKGHFHPGDTIGIEDGELWVTAVPDTLEPEYLEAEVKINFCPMCGRDLKEDEEPIERKDLYLD